MCSEQGFACTARGHKFCRTSEVCSGERTCDDGADEDPRLCDKGKETSQILAIISNFLFSLITETFCSNYCLNGGVCSLEPGDFTCRCQAGFTGKRCQNTSA